MPRPKRTKVASSSATRVVRSSKNTAPTSQSGSSNRQSQRSDDSNRGQTMQKYTSDEVNRRESRVAGSQKTRLVETGQNAQSAHTTQINARGRSRAVAKKVQPTAARSKVMEGLRKKMDAAHNKSQSRVSQQPSATLAAPAAPTTAGARLASQRKKNEAASLPAHKNSSLAIFEESDVSHGERTRPKTPSRGESDDIYGLSPAAKTAGRELEQQQQKQQSIQPKASQSSLRAQGTPAVETSIPALQKFKRRPRQPSILRMVQQQSDMVVDDTLNGFNPDDESTPLDLGNFDAFDLSSLSSDGNIDKEPRTSSSRKRKRPSPELSAVQVMRSSPPLADDAVIARSPGLDSDPSSLPEIVRNTQHGSVEEQNIEPEFWSQTMAPPKSTSSLYGGDEEENSITKHAPSRKKPRHVAHIPDIAPVKPKRSSRNRVKEESKLSTATLKALLPQRKQRTRTRRADLFDIPSSGPVADTTVVDNDEDELSHMQPRRSTKRVTPKAKQGAALGQQTSSLVLTNKKQASIIKTTRTYSRRSSDKENWTEQSDDSESVEIFEHAVKDVHNSKTKGAKLKSSKELQAAAKKFQEIDDWEMDFESVDLGANGSSPWR